MDARHARYFAPGVSLRSRGPTCTVPPPFSSLPAEALLVP